MATRSIDTATIAFGLVSIPVKVYSTSVHANELHFHFIHAGCGQRLKQQYVCPKHGVVERGEMARGHEVGKGKIVELSAAELKALDAVASEEIALAEFVPAAAVDPLYHEHSYYLGPGKGGERAYRLFRDALAQADLVGIATYAARGKQYVVELRPFEDGLIMHQLRYPDEVRAWDDVEVPKLPKPAAAELALAAQVIGALRKETFDPSGFVDEVKVRVQKLIATKAKTGEAIAAPEPTERAPIPDLMAALKASLGGQNGHAKNDHAKNGHAKNGHAKPARAARANGHARRARVTRTARARAHAPR